jgi:hypothetical protein
VTPEQNFQFRNLLSNLLNARVTGESDARQLAHEDHLRNYADGLLDEKDTEIAALKAHQQVTQEILTLLPECLKYPEGAIELLDLMRGIPAFYEAKAAYVPQPKPEPVSRQVVKKTMIERPPMIIFEDDE